jgi:TonB-dependent receptor
MQAAWRLCVPELLALLASPLRAQPATEAPLPAARAEPEAVQLEKVVVQGAKASLASARRIRREADGIVDAVVAEDIARLPDINVTDALQRVTGIQIARDRGEGAAVSIRGLTQMETLLNGREVFSAGTGRTLDFADVPAELLAGIDVYKTASADQIEGGVAGAIDLRTRRPFDLRERELAATARWIHGDLAGRGAAQVSALASRRWQLAGAGEFGALLSLAVQQRAWREDQKGSGSPIVCSARPPAGSCSFDLVPGIDTVAASGSSETRSLGERRRFGANLVLQWRPNDQLELYAEGSLARLKTLQDSHQINLSAGTGFVPGSVVLFPGTQDVQRITWTGAPVSVLSFARDTVDRTRQLAAGGRWSGDTLTLKVDLSYTKAFNSLFFSGPFFASSAAQFSHDVSSRVPSTSVAGTDLLDPAGLRYTGLAYRTRPFSGDLAAWRLDAELARPAPWLDSLAAGWRHARRRAGNAPGLIFADAPLSGLTAADTPGLIRPNPYRDFFTADGSVNDFLIADLGTARDAAALRAAFGITAPIPQSASPLSLWQIREQTEAGYASARFSAVPRTLDGMLGLRVVRTRRSVAGAQSDPASGSVLPIRDETRDTDLLPSLALRWRLQPGLQLRAVAGKSLTRPNFDQLSPSLTLVRNPVDPSLNQGSAGNPALAPVRARSLDLAIEHEAGATQSATATLFWKKVDGFVTALSQPELHDGELYQVSRPRNADTAHIRGVELAFQRFFDTLPETWRGFGLQANYTYVDSQTHDRVLGTDGPLQNLSRHSVNLIGLYERGPLAARLAYNWRDRFASGVTSVVGVGALPVYTQAYGWLDASLSWRVDTRVTLTLEGSNLLRTLRRSYYGVPTRPQSAWLNDRQIALVIGLRL